jgi:hypothetical protein
MLKPNTMPFQASTAMADSLEFIKNLWGSMGIPGMNIPTGMPTGASAIPGMVLPTLSVDELRKKITELRAVESWLELNMNMLRTSIQALEVQAATITTLQTMGDTLTSTMKMASGAASRTSASAGPASPNEDWPNPQDHAHQMHAPEPTAKDEEDAAALTAPLVNAAAWWNQLQNQFQQAVTQAMATEEKPKSNGHDRTAPARPARKKPAAKATPAKSSRKRKPAK